MIDSMEENSLLFPPFFHAVSYKQLRNLFTKYYIKHLQYNILHDKIKTVKKYEILNKFQLNKKLMKVSIATTYRINPITSVPSN
ncbi:hypothetical protein D7X33_22245 [Butyricicoccus sp. 1XD8-22]|nr:hypothetical protein D7X33_22245 [Butyricicoccus sp. 1XD8-22]